MNELVKFRLIQTPCCGQLLCWINPRFPNHCPECGKGIYPAVKNNVLVEQDMWLRDENYESEKGKETPKEKQESSA